MSVKQVSPTYLHYEPGTQGEGTKGSLRLASMTKSGIIGGNSTIFAESEDYETYNGPVPKRNRADGGQT